MRKLTAILTALLVLLAALPLAVQASAPTCPLSGARGKAVESLAVTEASALLSELDCMLATNYADTHAREERVATALYIGHYGTAASDASALRDLDAARFQTFTGIVAAQAAAAPGNANAVALLALLHWADARDDLALPEYEAILAQQPTNVFAVLFRGSSKLYLGDDVTSLADFQQAVNLDPNNPHVYSIIGSTQQQVGNFYDALMALDRAIQLDPTDARSHYFRGMALLDDGQYAAAHAELTEAVGCDPEFADAWYDRARIDMLLASPTDALADLDQALAIHPEFDLALVFRGALNEWEGDLAGATADIYAYTTVMDAQVFSGGMLNFNAPQTINLDIRALYTFTFQGTAGEVVQVAAQSPQEQTDPILVLIGPDGASPLAASDDLSPTVTDAQISNIVLPQSGQYTVLLTHSDSNPTGPVVLTLSQP